MGSGAAGMRELAYTAQAGAFPAVALHGQSWWPGGASWLVGILFKRDSRGGQAGDSSWKWVPTSSRTVDPVPRTIGGFRKEESVWRGGV